MPRKNVQLIEKIPLLAYSIDVARRSSIIDEVIVSTDDTEIAKVAKEYGANVAIRSLDSATDFARDHLLILELESKEGLVTENDVIVFLRPTHPIRNPNVIDRAVELFLKNFSRIDSVRSMKKSNEIPFKTWLIDSNGYAINVVNPRLTEVIDPPNAPRQTLPQTYYQDGYVEIIEFKKVKAFNNTSGEKILPLIIEDFSHDIDTFEDIGTITNYLKNEEMPEWFSFPKKLQ